MNRQFFSGRLMRILLGGASEEVIQVEKNDKKMRSGSKGMLKYFSDKITGRRNKKKSVKVVRRQVALERTLTHQPEDFPHLDHGVIEIGAVSHEGKMEERFSLKAKDMVGSTGSSYVLSKESADDPLLYLHVLHMALHLTIKVLSLYLAANNFKDFIFTWEELCKTLSVHEVFEEQILSPAVSSLSARKVSISNGLAGLDAQNLAMESVTSELKGTLNAVKAGTFDDWKRIFSKHILAIDEKIRALSTVLKGKSQHERNKAVAEAIISPAMAARKADFLWTVGWCTTTIVHCVSDEATRSSLLGRLVISLQTLTSPTQYTPLKDKIRSKISTEQWFWLRTENSADATGKQSEPAYQKPCLQDDPRFAGFIKMIRVGLPIEAAAKRMELSQTTYSYQDAMHILALDPLCVLPDKFENIRKDSIVYAKQEEVVSVLLFMQIMHKCFDMVAHKLAGYLSENNTKDFGFTWEEFYKAMSVHSEIEERLVFTMLNKNVGTAFSTSSLDAEHIAEKAAADLLMNELKTKKVGSKESFDAWRTIWSSHVKSEETLTLPLESKIGNSHEERMIVVFKEIMCPVFVQCKSDFLWTVGWCAMILSEQTKTDPETFNLLGSFASSLQSVCSPADYLLTRGKIKSNIKPEQWTRLVEEFSADQPGLQTGKAESIALPVKEDPRYAAFFKMLKMGLPLGAVAVKMTGSGTVETIEQAERILALDPNAPLPDLSTPVKSNPPVKPPPPSKMTKDPSTKLVGSSQLVYFSSFHRAIKSAIALLSGYLGADNMKDFSFTWEEFQKAHSFQMELENLFLIPELDKVSKGSTATSGLSLCYNTEKRLADAIFEDLKKTKKVTEKIFQEWKLQCENRLTSLNGVILLLEAKLGSSMETRASIISKHVISPAFTRSKADFGYAVGWCAMILGQRGCEGKAPLDELVELIKALQIISSPAQYAFLKVKIKSNVGSDQWPRLVKEYGADESGSQQEPDYTKPPIKDDTRFSKYFKMLKVGLPIDAAALQMVREGGVTTDYDQAFKILSQDPNIPFIESYLAV